VKPLKSEEIYGTWASILLPINRDESIDFSRLADQIEYLLTTGVDGIYSNGTACEFATQTEDEFDRIQTLLAEKCERAGMSFQIGASHMSAQISLSRTIRAAKLKPGAIQVIIPDWVPVSNHEAIAFLQRVAEAVSPVGLVLYNPPHAKRLLQPKDYGQLSAAVPSLLGIKVAGQQNWYAEIRKQAPKLALFAGGHHLASAQKIGAAGSYSTVACIQPKGAARWYAQMKSDLPAALELETRILKFYDELILPYLHDQQYAPFALDKLLASIGGWSDIGLRVRWPYRSVEESVLKQLKPIVWSRLPELFAD
jgi:dihydrodipicolinate synthase/N-acetylneuraminate lyase